MNAVVARLTLRAMLGRRRTLLLLLMGVPLLALTVILRVTGHGTEDIDVGLVRLSGLATLVPLVALTAGTGVLGAEIDDGTVVHLLAKPLSRPVIVQTKTAVAVGMTWLFGGVPVLISAWVLLGLGSGVALGLTVAALAAGAAYCALFVLVSLLTRHAVIAGLLYALIWEGTVGQYVPGARRLSIQQWALAVGDALTHGHALQPDVGVAAGAALLAATIALPVVIAGQRLRSFAISGDD